MRIVSESLRLVVLAYLMLIMYCNSFDLVILEKYLSVIFSAVYFMKTLFFFFELTADRKLTLQTFFP